MVFGIDSKDCITQSELSLGKIAADEIGVLGSDCVLSKFFSDEQEAGAAIEKKPCGFGKRYISSVQMAPAIVKEIFSSRNDAMSRDEVVGKHRDRRPSESSNGIALELDMNSGIERQLLG
jgi:hypothetical protein